MSTPTMVDAVNAALRRRLAGVRVAMPGVVHSYNATTQRASVQPCIMNGYEDEAGERRSEKLAIVNEVPIVFPGAGSASITWPLTRGDEVLLVWSSSSLDRWLARGGIVDPDDDRHHALSDAIAIPGLRHRKLDADRVHGTAMVLEAPLIHAGGDAALALKSDVQALANHVNTLLVGGTGSAPNPSAPAPVGTTTLKGG